MKYEDATSVGRRHLPLAYLCLMLLFLAGVFRHVELPGLYMDAINPDYLVARSVNSELENPVWVLPGQRPLLLGGLYYGVQNYYIGMAAYPVLGFSVPSARIVHGLIGALTILLLFELLRRFFSSTLIAFLACACLASDIGFIASFRTQNYIVLGGMVWFLAGLLLFYSGIVVDRRRVWMAASAICFGLAIYTYFVFLFFLPVLLLLIVTEGNREKLPGDLLVALAGLLVGLLPYGVGYFLLANELGGFDAFLEWMKGGVTSLAPMGASNSYAEGLVSVVSFARAALLNEGNELMILGEALPSHVSHARLYVQVAAILVGVLASFALIRAGGRARRAGLLLFLLPIAFVCVGGIFGARLGSHHFSVLVVLGYMLLAISLTAILDWAGAGHDSGSVRLPKVAASALLVTLILGNFGQQALFFKGLESTGGMGMTTDATTRLAEAAVAKRGSTLYVFPEWGFFMPFAFLTANRVPYELELSKPAIESHRGFQSEICVAFWDVAKSPKYKAELLALGISDVRQQVFNRRDGTPGFYVLSGALDHDPDSGISR